MAGQIERTGRVVELTFEASATQHTEAAVWVGDASSCAFVFPAEFNTDTITVKSSISGDTGFTLTAATGRVDLTSDQAISFFPMNDMIVTTGTATSAAATVTVMLKG